MANGLDLITALSQAVHPLAVMQRITDCTLDLIEPAQGVMIGLTDGDGNGDDANDGVTYLTAAGNQLMLVGTRVLVGSSLTGVALRTGEVQRSDDTELDDRVDREACRRHFVRSLMCVPLTRGDASIGVLAVNCPEPQAFHDGHVEILRRLAHFVSVAIASARDLHDVSTELLDLALEAMVVGEDLDDRSVTAAAASRYVMGVLSPDTAVRMESTERIQQVFDTPGLLTMAYQPVVDLLTDEVIAVEALARFGTTPYRSPDAWFAEAHACGLGVELELFALDLALTRLGELPEGVSMTVNVGPLAAQSPRFHDVFEDVVHDQVILELTEHAVVDDYPGLISSIRDLRRTGLRVAIDDTGSGYSSLAHILKIAPDFIKLDGELTRGIDIDPVRRALAAALVAFAADTGAEIVAEGVESPDELVVLRRLGVRYAQGYHLGYPGDIGSLPAVRPTSPPT